MRKQLEAKDEVNRMLGNEIFNNRFSLRTARIIVSAGISE